jgi:hypothetical protein
MVAAARPFDVGPDHMTGVFREKYYHQNLCQEVLMMPNIHTIIRQHVSLEVRCIDRIYVQGYMPKPGFVLAAVGWRRRSVERPRRELTASCKIPPFPNPCSSNFVAFMTPNALEPSVFRVPIGLSVATRPRVSPKPRKLSWGRSTAADRHRGCCFCRSTRGAGRRNPEARRMEAVRRRIESRATTGLHKQHHWFRTHELAYRLLRSFVADLSTETVSPYSRI